MDCFAYYSSSKKSEGTTDKKPASASAAASETKSTSEKKDEEKIGDTSDAQPSDRSVWVSGLSQATRASDLQTLFKKCGRVVGAKIITNTKIPGSRYYGLITLETKEQAEECIKQLHKTELNGRKIAVERVCFLSFMILF